MLRRLLLPVGALLALFSAISSLHAQNPKPAEAKPAAAPAADTKPPLAVTVRSDMKHLPLGESAVIAVAVKNSAKAPEVTMPAQGKGGLQLLAGPELRPSILDGLEPQDWPVYRNNGRVPGLHIIEAMRTLTAATPPELREGPKNKEVEPPKGLIEARASLADLRSNDWVFRYVVTPRETGTFIVESFTVTAPDGQSVKTDPIIIKVYAEGNCSCVVGPKRNTVKEMPPNRNNIREIPPLPDNNRPR
jgi:hypothetical protein